MQQMHPRRAPHAMNFGWFDTQYEFCQVEPSPFPNQVCVATFQLCARVRKHDILQNNIKYKKQTLLQATPALLDRWQRMSR